MTEWWNNLTIIQQGLWAIAIPVSVFFFLQLIMTFVGVGDDGLEVSDDLDSGESTDFSDLFTVRNAVAFFLGFSWGGLAFLESNSEGVAIFYGFIVGVVLIFMNMLVLKGLSSLKDSGNLNINNAIGKEATVSVLIPANKNGYGKVSISLQGRLIELEAITEGENIPRGNNVKVVSVSGDLLVVSQ